MFCHLFFFYTLYNTNTWGDSQQQNLLQQHLQLKLHSSFTPPRLITKAFFNGHKSFLQKHLGITSLLLTRIIPLQYFMGKNSSAVDNLYLVLVIKQVHSWTQGICQFLLKLSSDIKNNPYIVTFFFSPEKLLLYKTLLGLRGGSKPISTHNTQTIPPSGQLYVKSISNCYEYSWLLPGRAEP